MNLKLTKVARINHLDGFNCFSVYKMGTLYYLSTGLSLVKMASFKSAMEACYRLEAGEHVIFCGTKVDTGLCFRRDYD